MPACLPEHWLCRAVGCMPRLDEQPTGARADGWMGPADQVGRRGPRTGQEPGDQLDVARFAAVAGADDGQLLGREASGISGAARHERQPLERLSRRPQQHRRLRVAHAAQQGPVDVDSDHDTPVHRLDVASPREHGNRLGASVPAGRGDGPGRATKGCVAEPRRGLAVPGGCVGHGPSTPASPSWPSVPGPGSPAQASNAETVCRDPAWSSAQASRCMAISPPTTARSSTG